jgi:GNAT superfamily N-acetyltransferase
VDSASSSTDARIEPVDELPAEADELAAIARAEGFGMLDRLIADWDDGSNRFDAPGELVLAAWRGTRLVGLGGLNVDPWAGPHVGRVRRLFVHPDQRREGLGGRLLRAIGDAADAHGFDELRLRTNTERGAAFFESQGFERIDDPEATHARRCRG